MNQKNLRKNLVKSLIIITLFYSGCSFSFDKDKVDTLKDLMIAGCSLGQRFEINADASGDISFISKGIEGKFKASQEEIPSIIKFISSDQLKGEQANETRKCMEKYMNKIFSEILEKDFPSEEKKTEIINGILLNLNNCKKTGKNDLICTLQITSAYQDREITIEPTAFDDANNEYYPNTITLANHSKNDRRQIEDISLIADTTSNMTIQFNNISTQAKGLSLLTLRTWSRTNNNNQQAGTIKFRDISFYQD